MALGFIQVTAKGEQSKRQMCEKSLSTYKNVNVNYVYKYKNMYIYILRTQETLSSLNYFTGRHSQKFELM